MENFANTTDTDSACYNLICLNACILFFLYKILCLVINFKLLKITLILFSTTDISIFCLQMQKMNNTYSWSRQVAKIFENSDWQSTVL